MPSPSVVSCCCVTVTPVSAFTSPVTAEAVGSVVEATSAAAKALKLSVNCTPAMATSASSVLVRVREPVPGLTKLSSFTASVAPSVKVSLSLIRAKLLFSAGESARPATWVSTTV